MKILIPHPPDPLLLQEKEVRGMRGERPIFGRIERLIVGRATPVTISLMSTKPLRRNMKHHML